jgi:pilus assembly protein CpaC
MRTSAKKCWFRAALGAGGLIACAVLSAGTAPAFADGVPQSGTMPPPAPAEGASIHRSLLRIGDNEALPQTRNVRLGKNKALLIEMPRDLRDVMVSAPEIVDAVVQTSNRVHLIGKKLGQSNAFFFDVNGEQVLTLEISVEQDTAVLDSLFQRLLPGSNIKSEILNDTVILTGSVRNPVDSSRAFDIASRFIVSPAPEEDKRDKLKVINLLSV